MYSSTRAITFAFLFFIISANTFAQNNSESCLAQTVYHESRGTHVNEQRDIAKIVINRVNHKLFPKSICSVILEKNQFKWVKEKLPIKDKKSWEQSKKIATEIIKNPKLSKLPDNALYFKTKSSKIQLAHNLVKIKINEKRAHDFYAMRG